MKRLIIPLLLSLVFLSCSKDDKDNEFKRLSYEINNTKWLGATLYDSPKSSNSIIEKYYTLTFDETNFQYEIFGYSIDSTFNYYEYKCNIEGNYTYSSPNVATLNVIKQSPEQITTWPSEIINDISKINNNTITIDSNNKQIKLNNSDILFGETTEKKIKTIRKPISIELSNTTWSISRTYDYIDPIYPIIGNDSTLVYFGKDNFKYEVVCDMIKDSLYNKYEAKYIVEGTYNYTSPMVSFNLEKFTPKDTTTWPSIVKYRLCHLKSGITRSWDENYLLEFIDIQSSVFLNNNNK